MNRERRCRARQEERVDGCEVQPVAVEEDDGNERDVRPVERYEAQLVECEASGGWYQRWPAVAPLATTPPMMSAASTAARAISTTERPANAIATPTAIAPEAGELR